MIPGVTRVSLSGATLFFPTPVRVARISLAWWDPAEPEGLRDPVLVGLGPGKVRTLVLVWATDDRGCVNAPAIRAGGVQILPWDLTEGALTALKTRHASWSLDRHDLLVSGEPSRPTLFPCRETLRVADLSLDLERKIEVAARSICGA